MQDARVGSSVLHSAQEAGALSLARPLGSETICFVKFSENIRRSILRCPKGLPKKEVDLKIRIATNKQTVPHSCAHIKLTGTI